MKLSSLAGMRRRLAVGASLSALAAVSACAADADKAVDRIKTATPIRHVIIIVGENRSFDHLFATYIPKHWEDGILNLLTQGIVKADGSPGPNFAKGHQYQITSAPNGGKYFISADKSQKTLYTHLPAPDVNGVQNPPSANVLTVPGGDPGLPPQDQFEFNVGGTGFTFNEGPDTRIANVNTLPPGPFQLTGPTMPYDAYTGDTIHQYFQMYQQMDCAIDAEHVTPWNPTGCLHDLQSAVTTTYSTTPNGTPHDTGQTMAFFNMLKGDAPITKSWADGYTISDNYHQPVMGGTGPDSVPLGFADQVFFSDSKGNAITPPAKTIYNPDPRPNTLNQYTTRAQWFNCSDVTAPGIAAIHDYLTKLPYALNQKCDPGKYVNAVNINPAWTPKGQPNGGTAGSSFIPAVTMTSIGDLLTAKNIPWKYYGGGFNNAGDNSPLDAYCNICNPFEYQVNYPSMVADHMRDVTDLFNDIKNGTLPAVSYVKPDGNMDGHPASSKWILFEEFAQNIVSLVQANKEEWKETAIFITDDEGGGFYDSGFIQPVDFYGTGPRIPMVAISPWSIGGRVSHVYNEHSSFVKFVERNWGLGKLTSRSRDNLPNPKHNWFNPYVPANMPAIGDLFDMFDFDGRVHDFDGHDGDDR